MRLSLMGDSKRSLVSSRTPQVLTTSLLVVLLVASCLGLFLGAASQTDAAREHHIEELERQIRNIREDTAQLDREEADFKRRGTYDEAKESLHHRREELRQHDRELRMKLEKVAGGVAPSADAHAPADTNADTDVPKDVQLESTSAHRALSLNESLRALSITLSSKVQIMTPKDVLNHGQANEATTSLILFYAPDLFPHYDFDALLALWADLDTLFTDGRVSIANHQVARITNSTLRARAGRRVLTSSQIMQLSKGKGFEFILGLVDGTEYKKYVKHFFAPLRVRRTYRLHPSVSQKLNPETSAEGDADVVRTAEYELERAKENAPILYFPHMEGYAPMYAPPYLLRVMNESVASTSDDARLKNKKGVAKNKKVIAGPEDPLDVLQFLGEETAKANTLSDEEDKGRRRRYMRAVGPPHLWNREPEERLRKDPINELRVKRDTASKAQSKAKLDPTGQKAAAAGGDDEDEDDDDGEEDPYIEGIAPQVNRDELFARDFTDAEVEAHIAQLEKRETEMLTNKARPQTVAAKQIERLKAEQAERERTGVNDGDGAEYEEVSPEGQAELEALREEMGEIETEMRNSYRDRALDYLLHRDASVIAAETAGGEDEEEDTDPTLRLHEYVQGPGVDRAAGFRRYTRDLDHYRQRQAQREKEGFKTKRERIQDEINQRRKKHMEMRAKVDGATTDEERERIETDYYTHLVADYLNENREASMEYQNSDSMKLREKLRERVEQIEFAERQRRIRLGKQTRADERNERLRILQEDGARRRYEVEQELRRSREIQIESDPEGEDEMDVTGDN